MSIAPPFWGQITTGDHPAGDGLTIFQTAFEDAVSDDISVSALGAGTVLGTVASDEKVDGYYESLFDAVSTFPRGITWNGFSELSLGSGEPLTCEVFFTCIEVVSDAASTGKILQLQFGTVTLDVYMNPYSGGVNPILFDSGTLDYTTTTDAFAGMHHVALVYRTTNVADVYFNGTRIITGEAFVGAATGVVQMGGSNTSNATRWTMRYHGGRVRRAEMYTGASDTVPASTADWGPP